MPTTVTVNKQALIETLQRNRDEHRALFLKAQDVYRERVIEELDKRLLAARTGGAINLWFGLPEPKDYTKAYDTVIAMLEWEVGGRVEISQQDFHCYVENNWEWAQQFAASTTSYLAD